MLLGELDIDGTPALSALHKVSEGIERFEHKLQSLATSFGGFYLAFEAVEKIVSNFEGILSMGAQMESLHVSTGESVHDLVIFGHALDTTGGSAASAQNFIFKLQNAIAGVNEDGRTTAEALHLLGTSAEELRAAPLLKQVEILQKGLAKIPDQATKVAAIKDLFGFRFAAQAMPLLTNPEALEHAKSQAEPLANVMDRNAEKFHELEVAIKGLQVNFQAFFAGALEGMAPTARDLADAIASIDFVDLGRTAGVVLNIFLQLAKVMTLLVPIINAIAHALASMNTGMLTGAVAGAALGTVAAGPLGTVIGAIAGGYIGNVVGGDDKKAKPGFADAFKGLMGDTGSGKDSPVSSLQRIGRGGGFGGDALLSETQRISGTLMRIEQKISGPTIPSGIPGIEFPAV
jgi:hypothetical protein